VTARIGILQFHMPDLSCLLMGSGTSGERYRAD
jgi:hypothetical protein